MNVAFRVDASIRIGTGHVMRCLTIASALKTRDIESIFVCRAHEGSLTDYIRAQGFTCRSLPTADVAIENGENRPVHASWLGATWELDAAQTKECIQAEAVDWLVVDHYSLDHLWESEIKSIVPRIMVIDDLVDRKHDADVLLDQTYRRRAGEYQPMVPSTCRVLSGSAYALLRAEFAEKRQFSLSRRKNRERRHLLISMGGVDRDNIAGQVLDALCTTNIVESLNVTVVMGSSSPWLAEVEGISRRMPCPTRVRVNVENMAQLICDSDFAIGAGGTTTWERCCLGLPTVLIPISDNQSGVVTALEEDGVAVTLSPANLQTGLDGAIHRLLGAYEEFSSRCFNVCDGLGVHRLYQVFKELPDSDGDNTLLRPATSDDTSLIYQFQQIPETRSFARNEQIPSFSEHSAWMQQKLNCRDSYIYIIQKATSDVGVIRLDHISDRTFEISIYIIPESFGKGIASNAISRLKSIHGNIDIIATVMPENTRSQKLFGANGFVKTDAQTYIYRGCKANE